MDGKKSKKSKKEKKDKRKKEKKHKKKKHQSSSSSSDSESDSSPVEWVEKSSQPPKESMPSTSSKDTPSIQRDEWMTAPGLFACVTRDQIRASKRPSEKKLEEEAAKYMLDRPGQSGRELNPFWSNGGTGLPEEQSDGPESVALAATTVGDQGANWLRRALQRAKEQASESGRSLEDVAAERWGSLAKLQELLAEAEGRQKASFRNEDRKPHFRQDDHRKRSNRDTDRREDRDSSYKKKENDGRHWRRDERRQDYLQDREGRRNTQNEDIASTSSRLRFLKPMEDDKGNTKSYEFQKSQNSHETIIYSGRGQSYSKSHEKSGKSYDSSEREGSKSGFLRPHDSYDEGSSALSSKNLKGKMDYNSSSGTKNWRKKDYSPKQVIKESEKDVVVEQKEERILPPPSHDSSSDSEDQTPSSTVVLSDQQMNELAAKLVKAEILGNTDLAAELKKKLEAARQSRSENPKAVAAIKAKRNESEVVILTHTDSKGFSRPLQPNSAHPEPTGGRRRKQKVDTHGMDGKRARYFPDDDKYSLQDMFQKEKLTTVEDQNEMFTKLAGKDGRMEHDYDMDDIFSERAREKESDGRIEHRERQRAIQEHTKKQRTLDKCRWCFDSKQLQKHLVVALGSKAYICLPPYQSLTEGHCLVVPLHHTTCATQLDEDIWEEMQNFRKALVQMFSANDEDCVWFESAMYLHKFPHMVWHCVPLPRESGDMAPIYFKKAILECETEWSTNKKLVDLSNKDVRHAVPKGLPYFAVDFGLQGGFAHVIEDEKMFPTNFAQEIIGGMLDLDHSIWRKPRSENFDKQRRKVVEFTKQWQPFDFTKKAKKETNSDSDSS